MSGKSIRDWRHIASEDVEVSDLLLAKAKELTGLGLKMKDGLHLAAAITAECSHFFTTDDGILNKKDKITGILVLNPVEYITTK